MNFVACTRKVNSPCVTMVDPCAETSRRPGSVTAASIV